MSTLESTCDALFKYMCPCTMYKYHTLTPYFNISMYICISIDYLYCTILIGLWIPLTIHFMKNIRSNVVKSCGETCNMFAPLVRRWRGTISKLIHVSIQKVIALSSIQRLARHSCFAIDSRLDSPVHRSINQINQGNSIIVRSTIESRQVDFHLLTCTVSIIYVVIVHVQGIIPAYYMHFLIAPFSKAKSRLFLSGAAVCSL